MPKNGKLLLHLDDTDDEMYMTSDFKVSTSPIKEGGLELEHERQSGRVDTVILYAEHVKQLYETLRKFLGKAD